MDIGISAGKIGDTKEETILGRTSGRREFYRAQLE